MSFLETLGLVLGGCCLSVGVSMLLVRRRAVLRWETWIADGWTLSESTSERMFKENGTRPSSEDKRASAVAWVKQAAESAGVKWSDEVAAFAAKQLEIHHWKHGRKAKEPQK